MPWRYADGREVMASDPTVYPSYSGPFATHHASDIPDDESTMVKDHWFNTYSGKRFSYREMDPDSIDVHDIAHSLAMQCRWNGHISQFYSVAQHSVMVSIAAEYLWTEHVDQNPTDIDLWLMAMWGLFHDAAETYMGDMVRPLKQMMPAYSLMENRLDKIIMTKFVEGHTIPDEYHWLIKDADNRVLASEANVLVLNRHPDYKINWQPIVDQFVPASPEAAEVLFLQRYEELIARP